MELKELEAKGRAALRHHLEAVLFDPTHPDGTAFRRELFDGELTSERARKKRAEMEQQADTWTPSANWERYDQPLGVTFGGRWGQLYTEIRFEAGKPAVVFVEID